MSTAIMGIPPDKTNDFLTDIDYRLMVEGSMRSALGGDIDEVILTYSVDGDGAGDLQFADNPGVADFLRSLKVPEEHIEYILSFEDSKVHGKLANLLRRAIGEEGRIPTLEELKQHGEALRPKPLSPLEVALYEAVADEKNLTNWLSREIRLLKKEYGPEIHDADVIEFLYPLQSIKDWYVANNHPSLINLSFQDAYQQAVEWEKAMAGRGEGLYYGPVDRAAILYVDKQTGYSVQEVRTENDLKVEGNQMHHCVAGYASRVQEGSSRILSLRDTGNHPHVTVELVDRDGSWAISQIKGVSNSNPKPEYKAILKRFFEVALPNIHYAYTIGDTNKKRGFRAMAIATSIGLERWPYEAQMYGQREYNRPNDITDQEIAAVIVEHAKHITAALQHAKRFSYKLRKKQKSMSFPKREVGLEVLKRQYRDEYGVRQTETISETTVLDTKVYSGDIRVFLGDVSIIDDPIKDIPLTPTLKAALDAFIDVFADVATFEDKARAQWRISVKEFIKERAAILKELESIGPERLHGEHFSRGLLKGFLQEQGRMTGYPHPSYANQKYLLEADIKRAESALRDDEKTFVEKVLNIARFSLDSFSPCAQKLFPKESRRAFKTGELDSALTTKFEKGRWDTSYALQYFVVSSFEKITGCKMFRD